MGNSVTGYLMQVNTPRFNPSQPLDLVYTYIYNTM